VRRKLEETFGEFDLPQTPEPEVASEEEQLISTFTEAIHEHRLVEVEYQKEGEETWSQRLVEPYYLERQLPHWYVHTWDRTSDGERTFRLDRMRNARLTSDGFDPRPGFDPHEFSSARADRILYSPEVARWEVEKGARELRDGSALAEMRVGSTDWLVGEILAYRGEAIVLEPEDLRAAVAARAGAMAASRAAATA
jgi:proteasome accessory factor C